jgi:hypothetical protein
LLFRRQRRAKNNFGAVLRRPRLVGQNILSGPPDLPYLNRDLVGAHAPDENRNIRDRITKLRCANV